MDTLPAKRYLTAIQNVNEHVIENKVYDRSYWNYKYECSKRALLQMTKLLHCMKWVNDHNLVEYSYKIKLSNTSFDGNIRR